ncbi:MAG: lamin tail domain-containing protein [Candidatus Marinimicrobia bacterium]|nr:lamin tail domain-containing protein [Candidatus Neomarinimicrobiota bacterium]
MRKLVYILIIVGSLSLTTQAVFAWNDETTHPALTNNAVDFYNLNFEKQITSQEKEWIINGSEEEDTPPRWINHFYDPIYNEGWTGENGPMNAGEDLVQRLSKLLLSTEDAVSAKNWVHNQELQTKYKPYKGNQTWERAIHEYVNGNEEQGLVSLGYALHLLEDMAVPDHTRNDSHPPTDNSPLEDYCEDFTRGSFYIVDELKSQNYEPLAFNSFDEYFDYLANYSNNYFFSKDTINDEKYSEPKIASEVGEFAYGLDKDENYFKLSFVETKIIKESNYFKKIKIYSLGKEEIYQPILEGYWNRLSGEAIVATAGVIDLFFREVERAKANPDLLQEPPKEKASVFSVWGDIVRFNNLMSLVRSAYFNAYSLVTTQEKDALMAGVRSLGDVGKTEPVVEQPIQPIQPTQPVQPIQPIQPIKPIQVIPETISEPVGTAQPVFVLEPTGSDFGLVPVPVGSGGTAVSALAPVSVTNSSSVNTTTQATSTPADTTAPSAPNIVSPSVTELSQTFTSSGVSFSGTAEALAVISQDFSNATTTVDVGGNWSFASDFVLGQGTTTINFYATDGSGNVSSATTTEVFVDSVAPNVTLSVLECSGSLSPSACLVTDTALNISWASGDGDVDFFELDINGAVSTTTATSTLAMVSDGVVSDISVRAKDTAGNYSTLASQTVEVFSRPVVINEVAWAGTSASNSSDEWVELFNRTTSEIDLSGWVLFSQTDGDGPYINLAGSISGEGYYLVERTNDDTVSDVTAGWTGSFGNGLSNTGEILVLSNASTTVDETTFCNGNKWCPTRVDHRYRTMERVSADVAGDDATNWRFNDEMIVNGADADGAEIIKGTPGARNSASYYIVAPGASVSVDTTLAVARSPYFVNDQILEIKDGATLTIEPGVVVKFYNDAGLNVKGKILTQGTSGEPVVFTSFFDDDYGGDMNGDGVSSSGYPGAWFGVTVDASASFGSSFENAIFSYGGKYYNGGLYSRALLSLEGPTVNVTNCVFEESKVYGMKITNSNSQISNNIFRNNNFVNDPAGMNSSLYVIGGSNVIYNNTFESNARGLYLADSVSDVSSNIFTGNGSEAIYSLGKLGSFSGNNGSDNFLNGINLVGNLTDAGGNYSLLQNSLPYCLTDGASTVVASSTLTVESGVVVKGDKVMNVNGRLVVSGQDYDDILFTSLYDDSDGNDATNDGVAGVPQAGQFKGIAVSAGGELEARGFTMRYAGSTSGGGQDFAGIVLDGAVADISDALFYDNYPHGIRAVDSESVVIDNAKFENHNYNGSWGTKSALAIYQSTTTMTSVTFENNALGVLSDAISVFITSAISWIGNIATTSPSW